MCGITGILHFDYKRKVQKSTLKKMTDIISHRGPDGEGFYVKNNIGLGHRRLSIIDLDTGDQPMFSTDGSIVLVFNGEIYNYIELREQLKKLGRHFTTNSDTEVVIQAYEQWGFECQNKFNGMWALALWDARKQLLLLSRDRIGEKPLHYSLYNNSLIFASEIKSLFSYGVPKKTRLELLELYLLLTNIPAPYTFYKDIKKLLPGHYLTVQNGQISEHKYWDLPAIDEQNMNRDRKNIYEEFEFLLQDSVKIRMRSDVPYGAFLSGGLDSSSVVALMSGISSQPVHTFTIGFDEKDFDESHLAQLVADYFKTDHLLGTVSPDSFDEALKRVAFHYDEPFGDSSAIPTGYVSKFAAQKVKMVLTGDGGDEVLSGYNSYAGVKFAGAYQKIPSLLRNVLPRAVMAIAPVLKGRMRYKANRVGSVLETSNFPFNKRLINKRAYTDFESIKRLTSGIKDKIDIEDFISDAMKKCGYKDDFYKLMYINFKYDLPDDYLVKVDRMSMAYSLETRVPFLDHRLIEFMVGVDKRIKLPGWEQKSILKNTIAKKLPESLLKAPKKGFAVPIREWFKDERFMVKSENLAVSDLLNRREVKKIFKENYSGKRDNGNFIWGLFMLNEMLN